MRKLTAVIACFILFGIATEPTSSADRGRVPLPSPPRPNILIIVTDDQRSGTLSVMRATRRLFKSKGIAFSPAFVTTPLCCPARASLFSGRHMHNHGVTTNRQGGRLDQDHTIQAYLKRAGYRTALFGKFLNTPSRTEGVRYFDRFAYTRGFPYYNGRWNVDGRWKTIPAYSTHYIANRTSRFIRNREAADEVPWFAYVAPIAPHSPAEPEPRYARAPVSAWKGNPRVFEDNLRGKPPYLRARGKSFEGAVRTRTQQLRTLMSVDDLVEKVFRTMIEAGEARDTLAFFISDNGMHWAEHGWSHKTTPYAPAIRIPLLMRWPARVSGGAVDGRLATNLDVAPTVLDAAGLSPDAEVPMDGRSLLQEWWRHRVHLEYQHYDLFTTPSWAATLTRRAHYIETYDAKGRITFREFYRLRQDRWRLSNVLRDGNPDNDPDVRFLHRRLLHDRSCAGSTCP